MLVRSVRAVIFGAFIVASASVVQAEFTPPANGKVTEKQLTNYIAVKKDQMDALKSASAAANGTQSAVANVAIIQRMGEKMDAAIAAHGMTKDEFNWVDGVMNKTWMYAYWDKQWEDKGKPDLEKDIKAKEADKTAQQAKITEYEKAKKDGHRVLTKEQKDQMIASANSDADSANSELADREKELKAIHDEIAQHEKEADDADKLAKNPPADVSADDRPGYVDGKKGEAQTARDAAKDSKAKLPDAEKAVADAKAKIAAIKGRIDHPEVPVTDDEKTQAAQENDKAIADAKDAIKTDDETIATLKDTLAQGSPMLKAAAAEDKPDPDNVALAKKHLREYFQATGTEKLLDDK